jgi:hypothetical protein
VASSKMATRKRRIMASPLGECSAFTLRAELEQGTGEKLAVQFEF